MDYMCDPHFAGYCEVMALSDSALMGEARVRPQKFEDWKRDYFAGKLEQKPLRVIPRSRLKRGQQ